jgi:hypothetical protein
MYESFFSAVALVIVVSIFCCEPAHAYLDPGTGAFMVQMLLGGAMGLLVYVTRFRKQVVKLIARLRGNAVMQPNEEAHD